MEATGLHAETHTKAKEVSKSRAMGAYLCYRRRNGLFCFQSEVSRYCTYSALSAREP